MKERAERFARMIHEELIGILPDLQDPRVAEVDITVTQVRVNSFAHVEESILLDGVDVGRHARVRRAIIDKGVRIPPNTEIGFDPEADARRFTISDGIVVVPKGYRFE